MRLVLGRESLALFIICAVDTILTMTLIAMGLATEANPVMARCLDHGYAAFFLAKMSTVILTVIAAEWYRRQNPVFVRRALQSAIVAYVGLYFALVFVVNAA